MKIIGILTFHAAHNYGSMLQNYALQQALIKLGYHPETINLRTPVQKEMYDYFKPFHKLLNKKRVVYTLMYLPWKKQLCTKHSLFEKFLSDKLNLSKELSKYEDLASLAPYDAYIIGSDQCWNMTATDFDWSYFLGFTPEESRKLSYAISMGPHPQAILSTGSKGLEKVKELLTRFDGISVRDKDTKAVINQIADGKLNADIHVDPTLLLSSEDWEKITPQESIVKGKYIFFYNPYWVEDAFKQAKQLGKITGLPVVVSSPNMRGNILYSDFKKEFEVGPMEFLNLVRNAEYVIGRSFHLMVFCIIFHKRFIAVEGLGDSRINQLLTFTGLTNCATEKANVEEVINRLDTLDFAWADSVIAKEKERATDRLINHLR